MGLEAPNIILITIDALRYDHLGCYGYYRNTSPNIDGLAAKGVKFLQAISNGGQTPQSFPSILASALPSLERPWGKTLIEPNTMLAELLQEAGYDTAAFHSNPYLSRFYGYDRGFGVFNDSLSSLSFRGIRLRLRNWHPPDTTVGRIRRKVGKILSPILRRGAARPIVTANETTDKAISWLKTSKGKFFAWLHYMDVHNPYLPASKYARLFCAQSISRQKMNALSHKMINKPDQLSPSELETIISLYDAEVRYVDEAVGMLLDNLGDYSSNTIVILTADHGDEFGEHGKFSHHTLYDGILRVPLIIAGPGIKGGTLVKQQVSLIDLAPTVAEFVGIDGARSFQGTSLLATVKGKDKAIVGTISTFVDPRIERRLIAYRKPEWKYIRTESLDEDSIVLSEELYNLKNDPQETRNLHGSEDEEARAFELDAINKIVEFKQLKREDKSAYEGKRIQAKIGKLRNYGKV